MGSSHATYLATIPSGPILAVGGIVFLAPLNLWIALMTQGDLQRGVSWVAGMWIPILAMGFVIVATIFFVGHGCFDYPLFGYLIQGRSIFRNHGSQAIDETAANC